MGYFVGIILLANLTVTGGFMPGYKISSEEAAFYYEQGLSLEKVAERMGVSKAGVLRALRRGKFKTRKGGNRSRTISEADLEKMYVEGGRSTVQIAKELGVSSSGVRQALRRRGVFGRTSSEAALLNRGAHRADWESLRGLYESGEPLEVVADCVGCSIASAAKYLRQTGATIRARGNDPKGLNPRNRIEFDVKRAVEMNKGGMTLTEIGKRLATDRPISVQVISHRFKKVGYKPLVHRASKGKFKNYPAPKRKVAEAIDASKCIICPEKRGIQLCHIQSRRDKAPLVPENAVALCNTHHWCFDKGLLTKSEAKKLKPHLLTAKEKGYTHHIYKV